MLLDLGTLLSWVTTIKWRKHSFLELHTLIYVLWLVALGS